MPSATSSQTIGPFWHLLDDKDWADLTRFGATGETVTLIGAVIDGDGKPIADACVELWQADPPASNKFTGFGRCATDEDGVFRFVTVKPGPIPGRGNAQQAPHVALTILARGLLKGLVTRAYFAGEALNETDPLLAAIPDPVRRETLIATPIEGQVWRMDVRLQGDGETVFLEI
jgi:protocatechuate 3,4-dioxygenase, alpha subunit